MEKVTISPTFKVVIPRSVRQCLDLQPGQQLQVMVYDGRIELIPVKPARELRGFLQGMSTDLEREVEKL